MQDRRRFLLDREALQLDYGGQLGERGLHAVVHVDGINIGVAAEVEADGQVVGAIIGAGRLHVDHFVDADDLRLDRLRNIGFDDGSRSAGIDGGNLHLRRHDVGQLRDRDASHRKQAGERDDHRDDDRQPWAVDKERRDHGFAPASGAGGDIVGAGLAGSADTAWPGRTRCKPSLITSSPSFNPFVTTAVDGVDWPS